MAVTKVLDGFSPRGKHVLIGLVAGALATTAGWVANRARRAEKDQPAQGAFLDVDGVRVHYFDRGRGVPIVLLHGNTVRLQDFVASGLIDRLAQNHRVVAFDRPGFGFSERPRDRLWTASAQAEHLQKAMAQLGLEKPIVIGHSWGTLVALELALRKNADVQKLILVSGYYFPTARLDAALAAPPAIPVIGDLMRYTVSAVFARLLLGRTVKAMFAPQPVPADFLPVLVREMLVRPSQIGANAEDAAFMVPGAAGLSQRYRELTIPVAIFAGEADKIVNPDTQARRLHAALSNSKLHVIPGLGHMLHYTVPEQLVAAVAKTLATATKAGSAGELNQTKQTRTVTQATPQ